jgi:hypothetical protein
MRNDWRVRAVVLLGSILAAAGCSTTQPDTLGTRTASLRIDARFDTTELFNCYQIWANDINGDLVYQGFNECDPVSIATPTNRAVPWRYSLGITIIHRGSTTEELVTSLTGVLGTTLIPGDGIDDFISMTPYDPSEPDADFKPPEERPGYGTVQFLNGKKVSRGSPLWLETNFFVLGDPNILTASPSFDFEVNSGDTVIVRARKQLFADAPDFIPPSPNPNIQINGVLTVGGISVNPSGTKLSSIADGSSLSFSFTVQ